MCGSSSAGNTESTIAAAVVTNPSTATTIATGRFPGTRITSGPAGWLCAHAIAANSARNGRKVVMIVMLTITSYAPCTLVPAWPSAAISIPASPYTTIATHGVWNRGCTRANTGGK